MQGKVSSAKMLSIVKSTLILVALILFVLLVNKPVIDFNMMYPEQPLMYLANQKINSIWDLINVYLHPQMMHFTIPFFRPSGHFLMYQMLMQFLDWHNYQALIVVNLIFLAFSGFMLVRLYALLFPGLKWGGYIAFGFYLMHPALILSRFISLHFEFAYIFFLLCGLYCFVEFCQKNRIDEIKDTKDISRFRFKHITLFVLALCFYVLALTFKEPALMLGPVMAVYLFIFMCQSRSPVECIKGMLINRQVRSIFLILGVASVTCAIYLTLAWPTFSNPVKPLFDVGDFSRTLHEFLYSVFNINFPKVKPLPQLLSFNMWENKEFPALVRLLTWVLACVVLIACAAVFRRSSENTKTYRKSLLFITISALLYLVLPFGWGMGHNWHFSLTILMFAILVGFGTEYIFQLTNISKNVQAILCLGVAYFIGMQAVIVNMAGIENYTMNADDAKVFSLLQNAILNPPDVKDKLTPNSMVLIEDATIRDPYVTGGGGVYPFLAFTQTAFPYKAIFSRVHSAFLPFEPNYNGALFRYAYLKPYLKESSYPFSVDELYKVENGMIYQWLQHYNDIFCFGYDSEGQWYDKTERFKRELAKEKEARKMFVHEYAVFPFKEIRKESISSMILGYPDVGLCQYQCDQQENCKAFNYVNYQVGNKTISRCDFFDKTNNEGGVCVACSAYVKT